MISHNRPIRIYGSTYETMQKLKGQTRLSLTVLADEAVKMYAQQHAQQHAQRPATCTTDAKKNNDPSNEKK